MPYICCRIKLWWLHKEADHLADQIKSMVRERKAVTNALYEAHARKQEYERRIIAARSVC